MSHQLISLNSDLQRLRNEGFDIEVKHGSYLLVHDIPYVNSQKQIAYGVFVTALELAGLNTVKPQDHTIYFIGEHPHDINGSILVGIQNNSTRTELAAGVVVDHKFSNKPTEGYTDYYHKVTTYYKIIVSQAKEIDSSVTAKTGKVRQVDDPDFPFNYPDSNASRADIVAISDKLSKLKIAIVGLGGTGAYVLDFVAKTPVKEIHLFDNDDFLSHNAFRSPGAASIDELNKKPKKVFYLHDLYSKVHKYIIPHDYHITASVLEEISVMDFVFVCVDNGEAKKIIFDKLIADGIPFIDVGMGVNSIDGKLTGSVRTTMVTGEKNDHVATRVSFSKNQDEDYDQNIQIAELNALNASLAVIKWKKFFGFYHDLQRECNSTYNININKIINDETFS